jgi:hypothetical protein
MTALENISAAEDKVAGLQDALTAVESALETAEQIAVEGKKVGRCFRRMFKLLLFVSIVAVLVMVVKKLVGRKSLEGEIEIHDASVEEAEGEGEAS